MFAHVQLDHSTAQEWSDLGIDSPAVVKDDVDHNNQILASESDDAMIKAEITKLLEED